LVHGVHKDLRAFRVGSWDLKVPTVLKVLKDVKVCRAPLDTAFEDPRDSKGP
jgi:hypothetical protein